MAENKYRQYDPKNDQDILDAVRYVVRYCVKNNAMFNRFSFDEMVSEGWIQAKKLGEAWDPDNEKKCSYISYLFKFLPYRVYDALMTGLENKRRNEKTVKGVKLPREGPRFVDKFVTNEDIGTLERHLSRESGASRSNENRYCSSYERPSMSTRNLGIRHEIVVNDLTDREEEVAHLLLRGVTGRSISISLGVSETRISQIKRKIKDKVSIKEVVYRNHLKNERKKQ